MKIIDTLSTGWKAWVVLLLLPMVAAAPGVFSLPALDRDESRFAQASKQMLETGDYIRIQYQDELRNKKPAGIHWLQAGATAALGDDTPTEIWTYRVPSWIGAGLAAIACFWCGIILIGRRAAFLGAAMFGTTLLLTSEAHISKTDAVLVWLTAWAMGALARLYVRQDQSKQMAWLFLFVCGLSTLIKGPLTLIFGLMAMAVLYVWDGKNAAWMKPLMDWRGWAIYTVIVLPWFVWVQVATAGEYIRGAVGKDLMDKLVSASEGHGGLPGYHLIHIPAWFFPAALLVIPAMYLVWRELREKTLESVGGVDRAGLKFLIAWLIPTWLMWELLPTKLSHYVLPAYPPLALLCGWAAVRMTSDIKAARGWPKLTSLGIYILGGAALLIASTAFGASLFMYDAVDNFKIIDVEIVRNAWSGMSGFSMWLWAGGAVFIALSIFAYLRHRIEAAIVLGIAASVVIGWHVRGVFLPSQTWIQATETARMVLEEVCAVPGEPCIDPAPTRVSAVGYSEPSYVMTLGTQNLHPPETIVELPEDDAAYPVAFLINLEADEGQSALEELSKQARLKGRCMELSTPSYALNYSNNDPVAFVAARFEASCN